MNRLLAMTRALLLHWLVPMLLLPILFQGCSLTSLPSLDKRTSSQAPDAGATVQTRLGRAIAAPAAAHTGQAGIHPLANPLDAFTARAMLARAAERTLDVQYYIWRSDQTGRLLMRELLAAADRGVRVRLLLDDNNIGNADPLLARLHAHSGIEVRLFNPFVFRGPRMLGYLFDFQRANRRMHNKSFTADNQATIVGGRNVGDEYFGANDEVLFADLDVLAVGAIVSEVSSDFDRYWASQSAYPLDLIVSAAPAALAAFQVPQATHYIAALRQTKLYEQLVNGSLEFEWANTSLLSDDPAKGLAGEAQGSLVIEQFADVLGTPSFGIDLISPYFVPTDSGTRSLIAAADRGAKVHILTNSLAATDVAAVHAGYARHRRALLKAGVALYEAKPDPVNISDRLGRRFLGSSASSLHAKTFAIDRERVYVGSFNFDPRSARLNTELGFLIESEALASLFSDRFERDITPRAYSVHLDEHERLYWLEQRDGQPIRHDTEPGTSVWLRTGIWMLALLPIDWQL